MTNLNEFVVFKICIIPNCSANMVSYFYQGYLNSNELRFISDRI